jgi:hypothetical protein
MTNDHNYLNYREKFYINSGRFANLSSFHIFLTTTEIQTLGSADILKIHCLV